jgi:FkbM family methyltransferase
MTLCFDIGANEGFWSLENLNTYHYSLVVALEASPTTYRRLVSNSVIEIKEGKIIPLPLAASSEKGLITFYECHSHVLSTTNKSWLTDSSNRFCGQHFKEIKVPTISIDSLILMYGLPDLIKIDVEGAELDVVTSLTQKVPLLCFEWASEINDLTFKSIDYLKSIGFQKFCIQFSDNYTFRPNDSDWVTDSIVKSKLLETIPKDHWGMIWCS